MPARSRWAAVAGTILRAASRSPPQQRRAGFLFQDYALFPHLTVAANVRYAARSERADRLIEAFGLAPLAGRRPGAISGGQQQRVALARALAADPALLLLDEPLSALDAATRMRMRHELRRMLVESGVPAIVVTHDRMEAVALGDWMAVIVEGRIRQAGPIQSVFRRPADAQVAESVGVENVLPGAIIGRDSRPAHGAGGHRAFGMCRFGRFRRGFRMHSRGRRDAVAGIAAHVKRAKPPVGPGAIRDLGRAAGAGGTGLRVSPGGGGDGAIGGRDGVEAGR